MAQWIRVLIVGVAVLAMAAGGQVIAAPYAAIVVDMRDGRVLHSRSADRRQHPASLTKMMTLYLTFEAVKNGQVSLNTRTRISRKAARMTGSRLRLKSGERVTIRDLIRATAIKSANDAALALAEAIGGSEKAFAQMMTQKARELGMNATTYKNPHGLTRAGHLTTARDQALLARHLYFDFPEYYNIFARRSDSAAGRRIYTTNRLLGSYRGMEGMKTGYTRAAGYNLVGIAKRGQERVIAVVLGGKSSARRNRKVAELLNVGFKRAHSKVATVRPGRRSVVVARAPLPVPKPGTPATGFRALTAALASPAAAATAPASVRISKYAPASSRIPVPRQSKGGDKPSSPDVQIVAAQPAAHELLGIPMPPVKPRWSVDLGLYADEAGAVARLANVAQKPGLELGGARSTIEPKQRRGKTVYHVTFSGFTKDEAQAVCATVGRLCSAIPPGQGG